MLNIEIEGYTIIMDYEVSNKFEWQEIQEGFDAGYTKAVEAAAEYLMVDVEHVDAVSFE